MILYFLPIWKHTFLNSFFNQFCSIKYLLFLRLVIDIIIIIIIFTIIIIINITLHLVHKLYSFA